MSARAGPTSPSSVGEAESRGRAGIRAEAEPGLTIALWQGIASVVGGRGANKFSTHVPSQSPNHLITTASSWFIGREKQRKVIRDFEAVRLQSHTAVGIVFNQTRMFLALSKHDCGHTSKRVAGCASSLPKHALTSRFQDLWRRSSSSANHRGCWPLNPNQTQLSGPK